MSLGYVDTMVFVTYLLAVVVLGFWVGRGGRGTSEEYFLAGRSIPWYAVGASFIGSNISTEHFIGMVGAAYVYGICVANWEWLNVWTFSILIWIFIPFLLATRVFSAPEFLERRFNSTCRLIFAVLTVIASVFAFLAAVLYAGAIGLDAIFDVQGLLQSRFGLSEATAPFVATSLCVAALAITTGSYAIFGGLRSVIWTDVFQVAVMFVGAILVTALGLMALGGGDPVAGWKTMVAANRGLEVPAMPASGYGAAIAEGASQSVPGADHYDRLSLIQPLNHKIVPWPMLFLIWLSVSIWYNCINQFMIQRVLAAKDIWHARMGIVFSGFMKILLPLIIVVPGLIMFTMEPRLPDPDKSYPILVQRLVPVGLKGLLLATLIGAIQSTVSSVLNSTSTVITLDIYRRFIKRQAAPAAGEDAAGGAGAPSGQGVDCDGGADRRTVRIGLAVSTVVLLVAAALAPFIGLLEKGVFIYIQDLYAHFAPPFSAVFVVGLLWKRANAQGALAAIVAGLVLSLLIAFGSGLLPWLAPVAPFLVRATVVWFFCVAVMAAVSLLTERPPAHKVTDETTINWRRLNIFGGLGAPWYKNVVLWWGLFVVCILVLYVVYSGAF